MLQWQGARRNGCFRRLASVPDTKKLPQTQYDIKVRVTCMHMLQESGWFCQSLLPLDRPKIYVLLSTFILFISKVVRVIKLGECSRPVTQFNICGSTNAVPFSRSTKYVEHTCSLLKDDRDGLYSIHE